MPKINGIDYRGSFIVNNFTYSGQGVSVVAHGADITGTINSYNAITGAIASISSLGDVYFQKGTYKLSTDLSQAAGVRFIFEDGAMISIDGGVTLTLNGPVDYTPGQQIFAGNGTVAWANGQILHAECFGIDGTADEVEINKAMASLPTPGGVDASIGGGEVQLLRKLYSVSDSIVMQRRVSLVGQSGTRISMQGDFVGFDFTDVQYANLKHIDVLVYDGLTSPVIKLELAHYVKSQMPMYNELDDIIIRNPYTGNTGWTGILLHGNAQGELSQNVFRRIRIGSHQADTGYSAEKGCNIGIDVQNDADTCYINANKFEECLVYEPLTYGVRMEIHGVTNSVIARNMFTDVRIQCSSTGSGAHFPDTGFLIAGSGNMFLNCFAWDWPNYSPVGADHYAFDISTDANQTTILSLGGISGTILANSTKQYIRDQGTETRIILPSQKEYRHRNLRIISADGLGDYTTLSDAYAGIGTPSDTNRYMFVVIGKITETVQVVFDNYVDIIGNSALVVSSIDGHALLLGGKTNLSISDITFQKTGSGNTAFSSVLSVTSPGSNVRINNCKFENNSSGSGSGLNQHGVWVSGNCTDLIFKDCTAIGGTSGGQGWYLAATAEDARNLIFDNCTGLVQATSMRGFYLGSGTQCLLKECLALTANVGSSAGYILEDDSAPLLQGCIAKPKEFSYSWNYDSANNGQFQPFADNPYQVVGVMVEVNVANVGVTLDIGNSIAGTEVVSAVDVGSTGRKYIDITRAEVASGNYLYATPSAGITNGDITIHLKVCYNNVNGLSLILDTTGYARISNCTFLANGASNAVLINADSITTTNWLLTNSHLETYDTTNQYAISAASALADSAKCIKNCTLIGNTNNLNIYTENITSAALGTAASVLTPVTLITTSGSVGLEHVTLADGYSGQIKHFSVIAAGNVGDSVDIAPTHFAGGTQITFNADPTGKGCSMVFDGTNWSVFANNGGVVA